jgi:hypothetical protein
MSWQQKETGLKKQTSRGKGYGSRQTKTGIKGTYKDRNIGTDKDGIKGADRKDRNNRTDTQKKD